MRTNTRTPIRVGLVLALASAWGCINCRSQQANLDGDYARLVPAEFKTAAIETAGDSDLHWQSPAGAIEDSLSREPRHEVRIDDPEEAASPTLISVQPAEWIVDEDAVADEDDVSAAPEVRPEQIETPPPQGDESTGQLTLETVIGSIHTSFPLFEAAYFQSDVAAGNELAAWGEFDTKFNSASENEPAGFYKNSRHSVGLVRPLYTGGEAFGGYRIGRGFFEPWYLERETNKGGEFKAGVSVPLWKNRDIDARRADLWRSTVDRQLAQPEIHQQLILFVRDGSIAYWEWIAAGQQLRVGQEVLQLARERNRQIARKVELGDVDPPVLQDNLRSIAQREAKLIDLQRKLRQSALKLSLFLRSEDGAPLVPATEQLADFPELHRLTEEQLASDTAIALAQRPEIAVLDGLRERIEIDAAQAHNDLMPSLDALLVASQDTGEPTSSKRDKSRFELEASLFMEVPIERRKAAGKIQAANAKLSQIGAKRRFVTDKISTEMQLAYAASSAAFDRLAKAKEARRLADYMAEVERRKFDLGESNLFSVVLREQDAVEAAEAEIIALLELNVAQADYDAAMARDWPR